MVRACVVCVMSPCNSVCNARAVAREGSKGVTAVLAAAAAVRAEGASTRPRARGGDGGSEYPSQGGD